MSRKHASRRDENEPEVVERALKLGASVTRLDVKSEKGVPDLVVGWRGINLLVEVKRPGEKLDATQTDWHEAWRGQCCRVESGDEMERLLLETAPRAARTR